MRIEWKLGLCSDVRGSNYVNTTNVVVLRSLHIPGAGYLKPISIDVINYLPLHVVFGLFRAVGTSFSDQCVRRVALTTAPHPRTDLFGACRIRVKIYEVVHACQGHGCVRGPIDNTCWDVETIAINTAFYRML